jgi:hypothetical protein
LSYEDWLIEVRGIPGPRIRTRGTRRREEKVQ